MAVLIRWAPIRRLFGPYRCLHWAVESATSQQHQHSLSAAQVPADQLADYERVHQHPAAIEQISLIGVLADRKKETVKAFLSSIPNPLKRTIKAVCSDTYDGYINAAKVVFGKGIRAEKSGFFNDGRPAICI